MNLAQLLVDVLDRDFRVGSVKLQAVQSRLDESAPCRIEPLSPAGSTAHG